MATNAETDRIESEIAQTRTQIDDTVGAIQDKLQPDAMVDRVVRYIGSEISDGDSRLMRALRSNPVPLLLIGIGVAWIAAAVLRNSSASAVAAADDDYARGLDYPPDFDAPAAGSGLDEVPVRDNGPYRPAAGAALTGAAVAGGMTAREDVGYPGDGRRSTASLGATTGGSAGTEDVYPHDPTLGERSAAGVPTGVEQSDIEPSDVPAPGLDEDGRTADERGTLRPGTPI